MRNRHLIACATIACLGAFPVAADPFDALPALCRSMQQEGWGRQPAVAKLDPDAMIEMSIPGVMYLCTLGRELPANDRGHVPELGAMLSSSTDDAGALLSAHWFCAPDRTPALAELRKESEGVAAKLGITIPDGIADAIRDGRELEATNDGIGFAVTLVDVDPGACDRVKPGDLGAVLGEINVSMERAK